MLQNEGAVPQGRQKAAGPQRRRHRAARQGDNLKVAPTSRAQTDQAFWVESINASGWQGARDFLLEAGPEVRVILVQEHKLADATEASAALSALGWHSVWTPAEKGQEGGWSAGTAVLVRNSHGLRASVPVKDARAIAGLVDIRPGHTVCFVSVYGKTGESADGSTNLDLHTKLAALTQSMNDAGIPLVMGGDWNLTPEKVSQLQWVRQQGATVAHAGSDKATCKTPTTRGRVLDFFVVSRAAEAAAREVQVRYDVPTVPHKPVRLVMDDDWAHITTAGLKAAPPIDKIRRIGPAPRPPDYMRARSLALSARRAAANSNSRRAVTRQLHHATKVWTQLAAQEIANKTDIDPAAFCADRYGNTTRLQQKKVIPRQSQGHTTRLRQAYDRKWCHEAAARLQQALNDDQGGETRQHIARSVLEAGKQRQVQIPAEEQSDEKSLLQQVQAMASKVASQGRLTNTSDKETLEQMANAVGSQEEGACEDDSPEAAREAGWRHWAMEATTQGAARGHAWTKPPAAWRPTVVNKEGHATSAPQVIAHSQEEEFARKWQATHTPLKAEPLRPRTQREALPRLTPGQIRRISKAFSAQTAYGTDGLHVTQYAWLGNEALECFSTLIEAMELGCRPPPQWRTMKTPLIPKKEAGKFRAIAVMTSPMRIWGKARRAECDQWEAQHQRDYFAAGAGRRPLAAVWRAALHAERRSSNKEQVGGMVCHDLEAFYDNIHHNVLRQAARQHGIHPTLLETALACYTGPRFVAVDGFGASGMLYTDQGVMAGCSLCTTWAKLATLDPMDAVVKQWGRRTVEIHLYIDDVVMCTYGSMDAVVTRLCGATESLMEEMSRRGIALAEGKTAVAASTKELGRKLCQAMQVSDADQGTRATFLGSDYAAGRTRKQWTRRSAARRRRQAMHARCGRVQRLRKAGGGQATRHIVTAGLMPQGTYASEIHGLSNEEWRRCRLAGIAASGGARNGQSWQRRLLIEGDCSAGAMGAPLVTWTAELWATQERRPQAATPSELTDSWEAGEARAVRRWSEARGPVDAIRLTMQRLQWTHKGPWDWTDDRGATIDLRQTSPRLMRQLVEDAVRRGLERQVGQRLRAKGWRGIPGAASTAAIKRVLAGKHLSSKEKGSLRAVASGSIWTQQRLADQGYTAPRQCALCGGSEDSIYHRVWVCLATADLREKHQGLTDAAIAAGPDSAIHCLGGMMLSPADDKPQANDGQLSAGDLRRPIFQTGKGKVYVDGSATTPGIPELRRASWAAVQIDDETGDEIASASGTVPAGWPQTAQAAEHCGVWETAVRSEAHVCIVGDCAGVVNESRRLTQRSDTRAWERKMYGGLWRKAKQCRALPGLTGMLKVKAHQEWQSIEDVDEKRLAKGNARADELAKQALKRHARWAKYEYAEVEEAWEKALQIAALTGRAVARWPRAMRSEKRQPTQEDRAAQEARKAAQQDARKEKAKAEAVQQKAGQYSHSWSTWQGQTRCTTCGIRQQQKAARSPCLADRPRVCQIADAAQQRGHRQIQVATMAAPEGAEAALLVCCGICGAFSQGSKGKSKLDGACIPSDSGRYALSRIRRGLHPRATSQWRGHTVTGLHQMQWGAAEEDEQG